MPAFRWEELQKLLVAYQQDLQNIVPYLSDAWKRFTEACPADYEVVGSRVQVPLILSGGHGFKSGGIPTIIQGSYDSAYHDFYWYFIAEDIDARVFDASKALAIIATKLDGRIMEMKTHFERMLFGNGNGIIAKITDTSNAPTYEVAPAFVPDIPAYAGDATKYARVNLAVQIASPTGVLRDNGKEVTIISFDASNKTITLSSAINGAQAGDYIIVSGSWGNEFVGLTGIIDNTKPYGGIDPTICPTWQAFVRGSDTGNDTVLTRDYLYQVIAEFYNYIGAGAKIDLIITTPQVVAKLLSLMTDIVRVVHTPQTQTSEFTIGIGTKISIVHPNFANGMCEVISSNYCPEGMLFLIDTSKIKYAWVKPFAWEQVENNYWFPMFPVNSTSYRAVGRTAFAFFALNRRAVGVIKNIKIT